MSPTIASSVVIITPPATEPVTLNEAKDWLRVNDDFQDDVILALLLAAREMCERFTRRAFITQKIRFTFDAWPLKALYCSFGSKERALYLPKPDILTINSITTYDTDNTPTILNTGDYFLNADSSRIVFADDVALPTNLRSNAAIEVVYDAGYGSASDVPSAIKTAIKMHVAAMYESRTSCDMPKMCQELLQSYRVMDTLAYDQFLLKNQSEYIY